MNKMNIEELEQALEHTDCVLDRIEADRIAGNTKNNTSLKTVIFTRQKIMLESEIFAQKIVQLCLTGR